ncbi:M3 family metallopeptidase [Verrucomicrobiaceae bacterium N1E253]|uniref:oligopeptidase A n=1 Tax=Oceaniferula marina TaxID=2748318 RepID=A0A851GJE8_9BACT|nr:M3 family metallopeptidase [Oceaniferula marina]NWK55305.1 M3 family metallopeptidase [Oceaniferula marina]
MPNKHPFLAEDYHIRWSTLTPEHVEADIDMALEQAEAALDQIRNLDDQEVTYTNTFMALETATEGLDRAWGRLNHLDSVSNSEEQRQALNAVLPKVSAFYSAIPLDPVIWSKLKAFSHTPECSSLDATRSRHVEETCASFVQSGAELPDDKKSRVSDIQARLSEITQKFSENVLDSTNAWELVIEDPQRLAGLPDSAVAAALADAQSKGLGDEAEPKWRFTLQYPSMGPVMEYAADDELRKEIWEAGNTVGFDGDFDNTDLIWEILKLRQEKAELLGFGDFADLTLERRMARDGHTALQFTEKLHDQIESRFRQEMESLKEWKAEQIGETPELMQPWEVSYWAEKRRKAEYDIDDEALRPYFPLDRVMDGMFSIVSKLYNIRIEERATGEDIETWHPECCFYDLYDHQTGELLGSFYADWHPRESKRGGAWMNSFETGLPPMDGEPREPHLGLMVGNMTKPIGDQPALMTHREVETIFHEFGHLLHHLLGNVTVKSLAGTNVAWDFVELPSQIMENFCWARGSLDHFARHYETGEPIPEALYQKMLAARNYMSATAFMRQLALGKLDLDLHINQGAYQGWDLDEVDREILADYRVAMASEGPTMARRFNHLFSSPTGYAAGYYSYKWAEVLDADAFTRFEKEGILNPETGMAFRECILSKGNSLPADELYRSFMGRDPDQQALLRRAGLA